MNLPLDAMIALDWAIRCFGTAHVNDASVRSLRVAEEAVELAQCCDVPRERMHDLVDIVYGRPVGDLRQEIGGVMMTITVMCAVRGWDAEAILGDELRRVLAKSPKHFHDRNREKMDLGLTGAASPNGPDRWPQSHDATLPAAAGERRE